MASSSDELPDELMIIDDTAVSTSHTVASCKYADDFWYVTHQYVWGEDLSGGAKSQSVPTEAIILSGPMCRLC